MPLSNAFLRLLLCRPPTTLDDLQQELNEESSESSDFRGSKEVLTRNLSETGLDDQLTFSRTLSSRPHLEVELRPGGLQETVVCSRCMLLIVPQLLTAPGCVSDERDEGSLAA